MCKKVKMYFLTHRGPARFLVDLGHISVEKKYILGKKSQLCPQLILQRSNGLLRRLHFQGSRVGFNIFERKSNFCRGWGSNCLLHIKNNITYVFEGDADPLHPLQSIKNFGIGSPLARALPDFIFEGR